MDDAERVAVVTTTYFPDRRDLIQQTRAKLATEAITASVHAGYHVVVIDGGSDPALFNPHPEVHLKRSHVSDMTADRRLAVHKALDIPGVDFIVWTEPEKLIATFISTWIHELTTNNADVAVPMRNDLRSYPLHQQQSEREGNLALARELGGELGDWYFGPRVLTRCAAEHHWLRSFAEFGTHYVRWASTFLPVMSALAAGERLIGIPTAYDYPTIQTLVEDGSPHMLQKRLQQLDEITNLARRARTTLQWVPDWHIHLLDGFTLEKQPFDIDLRQEDTVASTVSPQAG